MESCISFPCSSVPSHFSPQFPCFSWEVSPSPPPSPLCSPSPFPSPHSTLPLIWSSLWRLSVFWLLHEMLWFWPLIALPWKLKGSRRGGEWERGADLHSFAIHPEGTRLVPAVRSWHYHANSSLKSFTEDHYLVSKWKLSSCIKETYWLKQHTQVCSCLKSDASGERNKCSSIITVHACIDEKEDIAELKTNQQNNKTNHKTQQKP